MPEQSEGNNDTSKINVFFLCCTIYYFIAPLLKIRFSVPAKRVEIAIFNPRSVTLKVGLQTAVSTRSTGTENQILKTVAIKNNMHYSKQNTANATRVRQRRKNALLFRSAGEDRNQAIPRL